MTIDLNEAIPCMLNEDDGEECDVQSKGETVQQKVSEQQIENDDASLKEELSSEYLKNYPKSLLLEIEKSLEVGSVVESLDQAYVLYCEYARMMGFSVKKGQQNYFRRCSDVKMKLYLCSCEGVHDQKCSASQVPAYKKQVWRSNCKARLRVSRTKGGPWTVSSFQKVHNHEMLAPDQTYMLRSARHLSYKKLSVLAALNSAGIGVSKAFRFMEKECGGIENVGFIRKDAYNVIGRARRESKIQNVDAQRVLEYFEIRATKDPLFRWSVQLDDDGRLMNFFYRDGRCLLDYQHFGDVLSIDTTHKTNKYRLLCAPFVGMNHHRQNIMFGVAFLSDETTKSFEWLFSAFLSHMDMKEPEVIFSDEAQALINGIDYSFRSAKHRLCQWHINQNSTGHFGTLNGDAEFKKIWYRCMNGCETEDEFEETWSEMIDKYDLSGHSWFRKMYNIKRRWVSAFSIDRFSAGLHATSRSESTNKALKSLCSTSTCLYDFVMQYEAVQNSWRSRERAEDAVCLGVPGQVVVNNPLLLNAARVYTREVYKLFFKEFTDAANVYIHEHPPDYFADKLSFVVRVSGRRKARQVLIERSSKVFECSCCKFVTDGYFCNHLISVMLMLNIREIPKRYILKRWTKRAKLKIDDPPATATVVDPDVMGDMVFVNHVMRIAYDIVVSCKNESQKADVKSTMAGMKFRICIDNDPPSPTVKGYKREAVKVNGVPAKNPPIPKAKTKGSPRDKGTPITKKRAMKAPVEPKHKDDNPPKKRSRAARKNGPATKSRREELSSSTADIGLDLISDEAFGLHGSSLPQIGQISEFPPVDEDVILTL